MWRRIRQTVKGSRRRAVVAVQVAVVLTMLVGFAALAVDVSAMYTVKAESQRTADAAALAAASRLSAYEEALDQGVTVETLARSAATEYTVGNAVLGQQLNLDENDVTFGHAVHNPVTGGYDFQPNQTPHDAVRVAVRQTEDSSNGAFALFFAPIFGVSSADVSAEAIAMLVPRDIAVVADLSGSHNDDSELQHLNRTQINLFDVWAGLPIPKGNAGVGNGLDPPPPGNPHSENDQPGTGPGNPANAGGNPNPGADPFTDDMPHGPRWGWMTAYGGEIIYDEVAESSDYDPTADIGLYYIPRYSNTTDPDVIENLIQAGYTDPERAALLSSANDSSSTYYRNRVKIMLGLAGWRSKIKDEYDQRCSKYNGGPGNGNDVVDDNEIWQEVDYPFDSGSWSNYLNYIRSSSSEMTGSGGHSDLRYRYGIKTVVNYFLEKKSAHSQTPELADTPHQPMQAVKDAVVHLVTTIEGLESEDQMSLEIYGTRGRHEVDLTENYYEVSNRLNAMQAGHYDAWTNMGAGILRAQQELLTGTNVNPIARKVMFLLTDGYANVPCEYCSGGDYSGGKNYARAMAQQAADQGIQIFCVSVGSYCDESLMDEIATIGSGEHFNASGAGIAQMAVRLNAIFERLGGRRPVELIK